MVDEIVTLQESDLTLVDDGIPEVHPHEVVPQTQSDSAAQKVPKKRLGDLLIDAGLIVERHLKTALDYQRNHGGRLGNILVTLGFLSE